MSQEKRNVNKKVTHTHMRTSLENYKKLGELKKPLNIRSRDAVLSVVLSEYLNRTEEFPEATPELVMKDAKPVILTGIPGSGKTTFLREQLIPKINSSLLVLDIHDEYPNLEKINLGKFFSINFKRTNRKLRLVPSSNVEVSKSEADSIFKHLIMFQGELEHWTLIVEEGHRFTASPYLKSLIAEARKHMKKIIVVSHQVEPYEGLGLILKVSRFLNSPSIKNEIG
jgi:hypothetical protein